MPAYMRVKLAATPPILATTAACRISLSHLQQLPTTASTSFSPPPAHHFRLVAGNYKLHFIAPSSCCNFCCYFTAALLACHLLFTTHAANSLFAFLFLFLFCFSFFILIATCIATCSICKKLLLPDGLLN